MDALIVEDSVVFREVVRSLLCSWFPGLRVCVAGGVEEGHARYREHAPPLVLVDIGLPDGSGLDLVRRIKGESPGTTVAVCTSHDGPAYEEASRAAGADAFLAKSALDGKGLGGLVRRALGSRRGEVELLIPPSERGGKTGGKPQP
ncbi:MAG: response regulator [Deferrisomatales bacterium]|nr:response regulator [Deferrisomatales bacterium]